jgi:hypothetical protein
MVAFVIRCPQCPEIFQGTSVPRESLEQMLETDEEITVMGSQCGHVWPISDQEKQNICKALAVGTI